MRLPYFSFLFFLCSFSSALAQDQNDAFVRPVHEGYQDFSGATILVSPAALYASPSTNSAVLKTLAFRSPVKVLGEGQDEKTKKTWYKVRSGNAVGFLRLQDMAQNSLVNEKKKKVYLAQAPAPGADDSLSIFTYDLDQKIFTDTFQLNGFAAGLYYRISLHETALKNAAAMLRITQIMPYCGGGMHHSYLVDANGGFSFLVSAFQGGDIGYSQVTRAWLPVKATAGKTQLVEQSSFSLFQGDPTPADIYQVHPSCDIPKEELVIVRTVEESTELDEEDMPVKNEDGSEKVTITQDVTTLYRWDGKRLLK